MICESEQARCHGNMGPCCSGRSGHEREIEDQKDAGRLLRSVMAISFTEPKKKSKFVATVFAHVMVILKL